MAIGGFIIRGEAPKRIVVRGIGPSLQSGGTPLVGRLMDPFLMLCEANGAPMGTNDDCQQGPRADAIAAAGLAPSDPKDDASGAVVQSNDNRKSSQREEIEATGIPPRDDRDPAIIETLSGSAV